MALASVVASVVAMVHNFLWERYRHLAYQKRPPLWRRGLQFLQFALVSTLSIAITAAFAHTFFVTGWNPIAGQLVGIILATWWSFVANDRWTWGRPEPQPALVVTREYAGDSL